MMVEYSCLGCVVGLQVAEQEAGGKKKALAEYWGWGWGVVSLVGCGLFWHTTAVLPCLSQINMSDTMTF